jgi:hypothetical protein
MIKKWHLKAIVQKTISFLPKGHKVNYWFQKNITKGVQLGDDYFYDRLEHAKHHLKATAKYQDTIVGKKTLELGTGWYPVVPFSLFLAGAGDITTVDISNLTNKEKLQDTFTRFLEIIDNNTIQKYFQPLPERITTFRAVAQELEQLTMEQILQKLQIRYLVEDARNLTMLSDKSVDLVHSNNTFEHVYPNILADILKEFTRVARSGGLQSHFVDMSDHFAHFDKSINIYNFLQYSNFAWDKIMDNSIQPQNRWRYQQYLDLYRSLNIPVTDSKVRLGKVEEVKALKIHADFKSFTPEQLAISHCYLYSKMD